jgi:DNA-nicking Smr family endonuclease
MARSGGKKNDHSGPANERTGAGAASRRLSPADAALWARVAETMDTRLPDKPSPEEFRRLVRAALRGKPGKGAAAGEKTSGPASVSRKKRLRASAGTPRAKAMPASFGGPAGQQKPSPPSPPPEGTLDRRTRQRMMRGQVEIEARLDLHGHGLELAHERLRQFIVSCRARGLRTVLVITGKGAAPFTRHTLHGRDHWHAPERKGQLRQMFPRWLSDPQIAPHVAGFQPAHPRHGGGGAFYVRLRRRDRGPTSGG